LDPQQVISRATGHFQPCFPASRPVSRPVFASKSKRRNKLHQKLVEKLVHTHTNLVLRVKPQNTESVCTTREKETDRDTFFFKKKLSRQKIKKNKK
jgi:hypothetical protein